MMILGESFDVVEVIRSLATEVDNLQKIVAGQEARMQVLEAKAKVEVKVNSPAAGEPGERRNAFDSVGKKGSGTGG